jgi:hypothetical protein
MIWLLPHPLPHTIVSELDRPHTGRLIKRDTNVHTIIDALNVGVYRLYRLIKERQFFLNFSMSVWISNLCTADSMHEFYSVADPGCLSRISDPDFYSFRIPDTKTATKERVKKICCQTFFCSHKFHKIENDFIF